MKVGNNVRLSNAAFVLRLLLGVVLLLFVMVDVASAFSRSLQLPPSTASANKNKRPHKNRLCCWGESGAYCRSTRRSSSTSLLMAAAASPQERENEIRRTISKLKRQGRIKRQQSTSSAGTTSGRTTSSSSSSSSSRSGGSSTASEDYADALQQKLGRRKAALLGLTTTSNECGADTENQDDYMDSMLEDDDEEEVDRAGQLGSLSTSSPQPNVSFEREQEPKEEEDGDAEQQRQTLQPPVIDPSLFDYKDDDDDTDEPDEEELIQLVAEKLQEQASRPPSQAMTSSTTTKSTDTTMTTTGVGGTWIKPNSTATAAGGSGVGVETYQPKTGSWGAFPRPKDISKAYGGGRRVGAGIDETALIESQQSTRERLQQYREKVGIDVQSEKEHANDIEQALRLAGYAMQRGMYSSAVSCLEKVTKYCSTNSKVGGKVFLELAMAYEAEGRTQEAVTVYSTLSKSRIEEIKFDAKRLLYGIEAMQFMRNEARSEAFSRKKIRNTFIDTTGLANIAENFDDVYQTAYIDLDSGFYRRLTESVVRSNREARQILLQATGSGMVEHLKIIQALRSLSRHFDAELEEEQKRAAPQSIAVMNGKPIVAAASTPTRESSTVANVMAGMDEFVLASPEQMLELLNGEWGLQLVADRTGDGVKYDNNSTLQTIDTDSMTFSSSRPAGFVKVSESGEVDFESSRRILSKERVATAGGGMLSGFMSSGKSSGIAAAQQVISVDSVLLVTRLAPDKKRSPVEGSKGYFSVWRRVGSPVMNESELEAEAV